MERTTASAFGWVACALVCPSCGCRCRRQEALQRTACFGCPWWLDDEDADRLGAPWLILDTGRAQRRAAAFGGIDQGDHAS